jgi:hypothetical protein
LGIEFFGQKILVVIKGNLFDAGAEFNWKKKFNIKLTLTEYDSQIDFALRPATPNN